jgi:hypothetical protein
MTHFKAPVEFNAADAATRAGAASPYAGLPVGVEFLSRYYMYRSDFLHVNEVPGAAAHPGLGWTVTATGAGNIGIVADQGFPYLAFTNAAADNDSIEAQYEASNAAGEFFRPVAGKKLIFDVTVGFVDANANASTYTQVDAFLGLAVSDSTVIDGATDFIGFSKIDGDTTWRFVCGAAGGAAGALRDQYVSSALYTLVAADAGAANQASRASMRRLTFVVDGVTAAFTYVDGRHVGTHSLAGYCPDTELAMTLAVQNGEAVIKKMVLSKLLVAQEW